MCCQKGDKEQIVCNLLTHKKNKIKHSINIKYTSHFILGKRKTHILCRAQAIKWFKDICSIRLCYFCASSFPFFIIYLCCFSFLYLAYIVLCFSLFFFFDTYSMSFVLMCLGYVCRFIWCRFPKWSMKWQNVSRLTFWFERWKSKEGNGRFGFWWKWL